jgi:hypothetical protein
LARLFEPFARADFISPPMLRDPKRYGFPAIARWGPIARPLLALAGAPITRLAPTWIYMLRKTGAGQDLRSPSASARRPVKPPR